MVFELGLAVGLALGVLLGHYLGRTLTSEPISAIEGLDLNKPDVKNYSPQRLQQIMDEVTRSTPAFDSLLSYTIKDKYGNKYETIWKSFITVKERYPEAGLHEVSRLYN
jgi:hypothetical protein